MRAIRRYVRTVVEAFCVAVLVDVPYCLATNLSVYPPLEPNSLCDRGRRFRKVRASS